MKILLINPPGQFRSSYPPLGLLYVASTLKMAGHDVHFYDANVAKGGEIWNTVPRGFSLDYVRAVKPDVIGISLYTFRCGDTYSFARQIRKEVGGCKIILGGPHPSALPILTMKECEEADFIVKKEGEETIVELVAAIEKGDDKRESYEEILGIVYRSISGVIRETPDRPLIKDLDTLPLPAYELVDFSQYYDGQEVDFPSASVISSRGCPYGCVFCFHLMGRSFRQRSAEAVVDEMKVLVSQYGVKNIYVADDTFTVNKKWLARFFDLFDHSGISVPWRCYSRVNGMDKEVFANLERRGCYMVGFGVETGSQLIMDDIEKGISFDEVRKAVRDAKDAGLVVFNFFMIGHRLDSEESMEETINFAIELNPHFAGFNITVPYPGTKLWDYVKDEEKYEWDKYINFVDKETFHHPVPAVSRFNSSYLAKKQVEFDDRFAGRFNYLMENILLSRVPGILRYQMFAAWARAVIPPQIIKRIKSLKRLIEKRRLTRKKAVFAEKSA